MVEINRDWFTIFTSVAVIKELYHTHITTFYFTQLGRKERYFDKFVVSPDNQLLAFLGKDGYIPLVSNKVQHSWSLCKRLWLCHNFGLNFCTVCLLLGLFVCLSVCLSVCLCVCVSVCVSVLCPDEAVGGRFEDEWDSERCCFYSRQQTLAFYWK